MVSIEIPTAVKSYFPVVQLVEGGPRKKHFLNILDFTDREKVIEHLGNGEVIAIECSGPFGFMVAVNLNGSQKEAEDQVDKQGVIKERKMSDQPAPFFVPESALDEIIDYQAMTRSDVFKPEEIQRALKDAMVSSGAFFQVALRLPFDKIIPYAQPASVMNGGLKREIKTGVVACLDQRYPALADIVSRLWEQDRIAMITSANLSGKQSTLTTAEDVWQTFGEKFPDLVVVDNSSLKAKLNKLGIEQCSYTLALFAESEGTRVNFLRQGNVDPNLVVERLNRGLGPATYNFERGNTDIVLTRSPRFRSLADFDDLEEVLR